MALTPAVPEASPIGVATLSFWHVHADEYSAAAVAHPDTHLVAIWDRNAERGESAARERGVPFVADLETLLGRADVDGVIVTNETSEHTAVILAALAAGKHVFSEKLLAPTSTEVQAILDAAVTAGVQLVTSLPYFSLSPTRTALAHIAAGRLGRVHYARVRVTHDGATRGWLPDRFFDPAAAVGGALTDLGCHPVSLMLAFMGREPVTISSTYGSITGHEVEDLASTTASFAGGGVGVAETSFVDPGSFDFEVSGDAGAIAYSSRDDMLWARGAVFSESAWIRLPMEPAAAKPFDRWVTGIRTSRPDQANLRAAQTLTAYVVASNRSASTGRTARCARLSGVSG
ncbi:Gfo/Idh/MocA family protein [Pseudolysinimonas yzui]|uniref:Dehydrogenase n=1 Tax=Pseudolysinimonas yzui TaxID=2708254 RepID=A0A8J3LZI2_9MICO|nr:Gfo/Idh/MocA family oxidoreductase [Pseudolysinimonas yzui]GHF13270.1 dehydrogenase [Pseudolysinimonas yzui]